jgi:hypothetical protein
MTPSDTLHRLGLRLGQITPLDPLPKPAVGRVARTLSDTSGRHKWNAGPSPEALCLSRL